MHSDMPNLRVDSVRYHFSKSTGMLRLWLFNDDSAYDANSLDRVARYDFGRRPADADGNPAERKVKLITGLWREPYRDGWKYTLSSKVHPKMYELVMQYVNHGWKMGANGEREAFTYLRHNKRAIGIHYLFEWYVIEKLEYDEFNAATGNHLDFRDYFFKYSLKPRFYAEDKQLQEYKQRYHFE